MRNLGLRLILWFIGVPAVFALVIFLPYAHHLAINLVVMILSGLGAVELARLFGRKDARYRASNLIIPLLGAAIPIAQLLTTTAGLSETAPYFTIVVTTGIILFVPVFRHTADDFQHTLTNIAANLTLLLYPGLFLSYIIRLSEFEPSSILIVTFFCAVFFNDSMAYTAGSLYRLVQQRRARRRGQEWRP
ncbi:MAG: phosphatidate cytidylyltransferase, partial [Spirochaetia bacterium]